MKRADLEVGKTYAARVDYTDHVIVKVLALDVERGPSWGSAKVRKDGVRVRIEQPYSKFGHMAKPGDERAIITRDLQYEWTAEDQERKEARHAERERNKDRAAAVEVKLAEAGVHGRVTERGVSLTLEEAERLLELDHA